MNIGQSYDTKKNNKFANKINQKSHLSDYAIEGKSEFNSFSVNFDTRIEKSSYNKKEMNVEFKYMNLSKLLLIIMKLKKMLIQKTLMIQNT